MTLMEALLDGLLHLAGHIYTSCRFTSHVAALPTKLVSYLWKTEFKVCRDYRSRRKAQLACHVSISAGTS